MRLVATADVPEGAIIARDVRASAMDAVPLLSAGAPLQPAYRRALERAGISHVFVEDDISAGIEPVGIVPREVRARAIRVVTDLYAAANRAAMRKTGVERTDVEALQPVAKELALEVCRRDPVLPTLGETGPPGEYLPAHSVDVAVLGMLVAARHQRTRGWVDTATSSRRYDVNEPGLERLGLALLLIDLGKAAVPRGLLEHPGPLEAPERATVCQHVELGADILPTGASYVMQAVMRHHHERWDGGGYPDGLAGDAISWEARVAAIADVFDATTSNRVYCEAAPQHEGWSTVISGAGTAFDPELVEAFREVVVPYPPGTEVRLVDGRVAVVATVDAADPLRPTVRAAAEDGSVETLEGAPVQPVAGAGQAGRAA